MRPQIRRFTFPRHRLFLLLLLIVAAVVFPFARAKMAKANAEAPANRSASRGVAAMLPPINMIFHVDTTNDTVLPGACAAVILGQCSLREAMLEANANPGSDTIKWTVSGEGLIILTSALPDITEDLTIAGPGTSLVTVQRSIGGATPDFRIFTVTTTGTVNFSDLTIRYGRDIFVGGGGILNTNSGTVNVDNVTLDGNDAVQGGAILNRFTGTVNVTNSTLSDNHATEGGGLYNLHTMTVTNSTLSGNSADTGGGIFNGFNFSGNNPVLNLSNSTLSMNSAVSGAGGIFNHNTANITNSTLNGNFVTNSGSAGGGIFNGFGTVNLTNSTVTGNSASLAGGFFNGGTPATSFANIKSTIIALNTAGPFPDVSGNSGFTSQGFNLIGNTDGSAGFPGPADQTGTGASPLDPMLDPLGLQNNGGPTQTIALLPGSPAIDKGTKHGLTGDLLTDQRGTGFLRTSDDPTISPNADDGTDIGAFEVQSTNQPPVAKCKSIQVSADSSCMASITAADVDDGSFDPDSGDTIASRTLDTSGPFGLGPHSVMLTVTDTHGASSSCNATVTVVDTTKPDITCPANMSVPATSPAGVSVAFTTTASDNCDTTPTVNCSPASGSTFPIGDTVVKCTASDDASPANQSLCSFKVHVKGAAEQVADLMALIDTFNLKKKLDKKFDHKLDEVLKALKKGKTDEACKKLAQLIKDVQHESGKKLSSAEANQIIAAANRIRAVLGCK